MEWSKNAVGNSMGGVEKNEVPQQGGADINWNSPLKKHHQANFSILIHMTSKYIQMVILSTGSSISF